MKAPILCRSLIGYYKRPVSFGGRGKSFANWTIPPELRSTVNRNYRAVVYRDSVIITGTGTEVVIGTDSIQVKINCFIGRV
jgi:hypothetical protein